MKLLLVGATGLVGSHVLNQALADTRITSVVAPVRRALPVHPKLVSPVIDYDNLPDDANMWQVDAVICTLGTTMRIAGSKEAFKRVDYSYPLAVAQLARQYGTPAYVVNTAVGSDPSSPIFYSQVKGELERDLAKAGFTSLTFVRPGFIDGKRQEFRLGEYVGLVILKVFAPIIPKRWRASPVDNIAAALLGAAVGATPGIHHIEADHLL